MIAHFVVSTVAGIMVAICGAAVNPRDVRGARVGKHGPACADCEKAVADAWVTLVTE